MIASSDVDFQKDYEVKALSKENCDEIFKLVDVEKLACDECHIDIETYKIIQTLESSKSLNEHVFEAEVGGFINGFNKAMELNKDKLFTIEDMGNLWDFCTYNKGSFLEGLESIQQPKEIEVDIRCYIGNGDKESDSFKEPLVTNTGIPKLDENGCLILKKK
jgi:hypothetical protein